MRPERPASRGPARILVDRLARNSIDRDPSRFQDLHGMLVVVDPQVPGPDRELLRYADPPRLADARTHSLSQLRRSRWHAPGLVRMDGGQRAHAARALLSAAFGAVWGTLAPPAFAVAGFLWSGEWMSVAPLIFMALVGWANAVAVMWFFVRGTGLRRRPRVDPAHAAAHRHPGRFVLPEDLGKEGRALVARADRVVNNIAVHERIPDEVPALREHLWRLADNTAARERARVQGADEQALDESLEALTEHVERLRVRVHQALNRVPVGEQEAAGEVDQAGTDATREVRARIAGTQASMGEFTGTDESPKGNPEPPADLPDRWDSVEGAESLEHMRSSNPELAAEVDRGRARRQPHNLESPAQEPEPTGLLHAHEITPDDAALIRMLAGAHFGDGATVTLPSGKTITGAEMRRWVEEQS